MSSPYAVSEDEYRSLDHFSAIPRPEAGERILRYRRNVIVLLGTLSLFYLAGISFNRLTVVGVEGGIARPEFVAVFLQLLFLYNFFMFEVTFQKEHALQIWVRNSTEAFVRALAIHIATRELRNALVKANIVGDSEARDWTPKTLGIHSSDRNSAIVRFKMDPEFLAKVRSDIEKLPGVAIMGNLVQLDYELSKPDLQFFENHRDQLKKVELYQFMDFKFPLWVGVFATGVIISAQFARLIVGENWLARFLACLLLIPGTSSAGTLYKCIGKDKAVSYQSHPCDATQRIAKTQDFVPERPLTAEERRAAYERQRRGKAESEYLSRLAGTSRGSSSQASGTRIPMNANHARCEAAKADRARTLEQVGLGRTYELLQRLDENVREACR